MADVWDGIDVDDCYAVDDNLAVVDLLYREETVGVVLEDRRLGTRAPGRYSREERQVRIRRYLQKKKARRSRPDYYACRRLQTQGRPRVQGRFVPYDDLPDVHRIVIRRRGSTFAVVAQEDLNKKHSQSPNV